MTLIVTDSLVDIAKTESSGIERTVGFQFTTAEVR